MRKTQLRLFATTIVILVFGLVAAACSSSNKNATSEAQSSPTASPAITSKAVPAVEALVPAKIKSKGTLTVAADATYAPNEFIAPDGHTVVGMDADMAKALGQVMGLKVNMVNATFDTIIPGLASGKYDLGMSSFTDTKAREKTVDFVTYFIAGTSFYVKSNGPNIGSLADLCGHSVAVEKGTTQQADAQTQSGKCKSAGKAAVNVQIFNDQNQVNLALSSGRAQVAMADTPVAEYQVKKSGGTFRIVGSPISYGAAPYGIAIPKNSGMTKAVLGGVLALMAKGTYKQILTKWGVQSGAISHPVINGARS
ncbi:MAG TPA: ABC transporter substrate-binding protein [Streptosporangiaceae bacterium]|jgi:polar amino acid transport system substrate-binding protein|nr:ABC transporter substrate-binding protein [Streptosporangiaceae bacterium]